MKKLSILLIFIIKSFVFSSVKIVEIPLFRKNWNKIEFLEGDFYLVNTDTIPENYSKIKIGYDKNSLYIKIKCKEEKIKNVIKTYTGPDIWKNDCVEIFIDTNFDRKTYHQFIVSVDGQTYAWDNERKPIIKNWIALNKIGNDFWETEIKIPFVILNIKPNKGEIIGMTFCRERWAENPEFSTWTPPRGFHRPEEFGVFIFGEIKDVMNKYLKTIDEKLKLLNKEKEGIKLSGEIKEKIDLLNNFVSETKRGLIDESFDKKDFTNWLKKFELIKNTFNIDDLIYQIKIEKLLSQ